MHYSGIKRFQISILCFYVLLFYAGAGFACSKKESTTNTPVAGTTTFTNPLLPSGPDPWITKKGNTYYYTHTLGNRIAIWQTEKVSALGLAPFKTIWTAPATGLNAKNVWAPEIHSIADKWYVYYTAGSTTDFNTQRLFVLENSNPDPTAGGWIEKGQIGDPAANVFAIDGTVFNHNGQAYFLWSGQETATDRTQYIYIATMTNPWTLASSRQRISTPTFDWERHGAPPAVNEGPQFLKGPTGKVFIIYSASGCWTDEYALGMLTLKDGGNPLAATDWEKSPDPVFTKDVSSKAYGPGHCSFFQSKDGKEDWILYHANAAPGLACGDNRNPRIQPFTWKADGTPHFGKPVAIDIPLPKPSGE